MGKEEEEVITSVFIYMKSLPISAFCRVRNIIIIMGTKPFLNWPIIHSYDIPPCVPWSDAVGQWLG